MANAFDMIVVYFNFAQVAWWLNGGFVVQIGIGSSPSIHSKFGGPNLTLFVNGVHQGSEAERKYHELNKREKKKKSEVRNTRKE